MEVLSKILFILSNGLMVPVILLLFYFLGKSLVLVIRFYANYTAHKQLRNQVSPLLDTLTPQNCRAQLEPLLSMKQSDFSQCVKALAEHRDEPAYGERVIANYEVDLQQKLAHSRNLIKFGPMLGLMGTLIPMGPALVGLASGEIATMAYNLQMAFATTVIGMLIAGIGVVITQVNQRFYARTLNDLEFIYQMLQK